MEKHPSRKLAATLALAASLALAPLLPAAPMDSTTIAEFDFTAAQQTRTQGLIDNGTLELQRVLAAPASGYRHMGWPVATRLPDGRTVVLIRNLRSHSGYDAHPDNARRIIYSDDNMATWLPTDVLTAAPALGINASEDVPTLGNYDYSGMHAISWAYKSGTTNPRLVVVTGKDDRNASWPSEKTFRVYLSDNRGATWSEKVGALGAMPATAVNSGPNMIRHPEFGLVVPFGQQTGSGAGKENYLARSTDAGETWETRTWTNAANSRSVEPALVTWGAGHMMMIGRERTDAYGYDSATGNYYYTQHVYKHTAGAAFSAVNFTTARTNIAGNGKTPTSNGKAGYEAHDTAEVIYNPVTGRIEMIQSSRWGGPPGNTIPPETEPVNSLNLWSIDPVDLLSGGTTWRFDGNLIERQGIILGAVGLPKDNKDGFHPGGSIVDTTAGKQHIFIYAGIYTQYASAYRISRPLDTYAFRAACGLPDLPKPAITGLSQSGSTITIAGVNLTNLKEVLVGGKAATITSVNTTEIKATLPDGAGTPTAADIIVRTDHGLATGLSDAASLPPSVNAITYDLIYPGKPVTITGIKLDQVVKILFGSIEVTEFVSQTSSQIIVNTPPGVTAGAIVVMTAGDHAIPLPVNGTYTVAVKPYDLRSLVGEQPAVAGLHPVDFIASATGAPQPAIVWQYRQNDYTEWMNLSGAHYEGVGTNHLTILNTAGKDKWQIRYTATNNTEDVSSNPATLRLIEDVFGTPAGLVAVSGTSAPDLYVTDAQDHVIRKITQTDMKATVIAGQPGVSGFADGPAAAALFNQPRGIARTPDGTLFVADTGNNAIRRVSPTGDVTTLSTIFKKPRGVAVHDLTGEIYVADTENHLVRKIAPDGAITIIAGAGVPGNATGIGPAAQFNTPAGIAIDIAGNLYVADTGNNAIRYIDMSTRDVTTLSGRPTVAPGYNDGANSAATFKAPEGLSVDILGRVFVADTGNSHIRVITSGSTHHTASPPDGFASYSGLMDGEALRSILFDRPASIVVGGDGNFYVADTGNAAIRRISRVNAATVTLKLASDAGLPEQPPVAPGPDTPNVSKGGGAPTWLYFAALAALLATRFVSRKQRGLVALVALFVAASTTTTVANTTVTINSSTTQTMPGTTTTLVASNTTFYDIADGATLTMARTAAGAGLFTGAANAALVIRPSGTAATGRLLVENIDGGANNGSFFAATSANTNAVLDVTNATFKNIHSSGFGAVILSNLAASTLRFNNVLFDSNYTTGVAGGGAIRASGTVFIKSGTFLNNYSGGIMGALGLQLAGMTVGLDTVHFEGNRAGTHGGAIGTAAATRTINVSGTNLTFNDNWAYGTGGAIYAFLTTGYTFAINMTKVGDVDSYEYTGNSAYGSTGTATLASLGANTRPGAVASAGGFYYAAGAGTLAFNIDNGVTLTIGSATASDRAYDSIASADANAKIAKSGSGTLVLNADNSYFKGAFAINQGRVILGNADALLGGAITIASGATIGGSGMLKTNGGSSSLTLMNGATVEIGDINAFDPQTLTLDGNLTLNGDATFRFDIFQGGLNDRFIVNGSVTQVSGTSYLDVNMLLSGTHNLGNIGGLDWGGITVGGSAPVTGARQTGSIDATSSPGNLLLVVDADISRALTWSAGSGIWDINSDNWTGSNSVTKFASGDRAIFSGATDTAITLAGNSEIWMADIRVNGAGNVTFDGDASIVSNAASVNLGDGTDANCITDATGKLHKTGAGTLTFANTGGNTFTGGIEIGDTSTQGGAIVFDNTNQLGVGAGAAIHFANTGTLRTANASVGGNLAANTLIDAGRTAVLSTQGGTLTYSGALSGGATAIFAQGGASDTLILTGDSGAFEGVTNVAGTMLLTGGTLGGTVNVASGAIFGGKGAATGANSVHAAAGSTIQVGLSGGDGSEILAITNLQLANGASVTGHGILSGFATIDAAATASVNIADGNTIALAATLGGAGTLTKTGAGTLDVTTGKLQAGTVTVQQGRLRVSGNTISVNALNINAAGMLTGAGRVTVGSGGLVNAGAIKVGRAGGNAFHGTMNIDGNYTGSGGIVELAFSNGTTQKDVLNINGTVGGSTSLVIIPINTVDVPSALPTGLVTVNDGLGAVPEGAFTVAGSGVIIGSNPYPYTYNPVTGKWSSAGAPIAAVPAAAGLDVATLLIGKATLGSLSQRLGTLRDNTALGSMQVWVNGLYRHDKLGAGACEDAVNSTAGLQAGADWTRAINEGKTRFTLGIFLDYASADMDMDSDIASTTTKSKAAGIYARLRGSSWYADAIFRAGLLDYTVDVPGLPSFDTEGNSWAASIEVGRAIGGIAGWTIEPQAQLIYQSTFMDDATDSQGFVYRANGTESIEGRAGARIWRQFTLKNNRSVTPYVRASYVYEFKSDSALYVSDYVFANDLRGGAGMVDAGVSVQFTRNFSMDAGAAWLKGSKIGSYAFNVSAAIAW